MTAYKGFAPRSSELATADNAAITVQAVSPAPIAVDASAKWEIFTARPGVAATGSAFKKAASGAKWVWQQEEEHANGKKFFTFLRDVFNAIALPILSLVWLALNSLYTWVRNPETRAAAVSKWRSLKSWAAPKFDYEREQADEAAIEL